MCVSSALDRSPWLSGAGGFPLQLSSAASPCAPPPPSTRTYQTYADPTSYARIHLWTTKHIAQVDEWNVRVTHSVSSSGTVCGHVTAISFPSMWWLKSNIKGRLLTITQRETSIGHIWILHLLSLQSSLQAINLLDFSSDEFEIIKEWVSCEGKHEKRGTHCGVTLHWQKLLAELVDQ